MKNSNKSRPIKKTINPRNIILVFDKWYHKTIQETVTEGMQLVHKLINEGFSTKPINYEDSKTILEEMLRKLAAVDKLSRLMYPFIRNNFKDDLYDDMRLK